MKVLVTGGAGFIGSAVCRHFVREESWHVLNVDKLTYASNTSSLADLDGRSNYRFSRTDVCDRTALDDLFASFEPDTVVHLAAESHVDRSITGSAAFLATNVVGTHTLLEAALAYWERLATPRRDAFRFLHVSTDEVFGSLGPTGHFHEATAYDPRSPYSATKAASDHLAKAWYHTYGLPVIVSNCSNNYGPYQFPEKLIPVTIINALEERPLPVYGDGGNVRDWLFVTDHVRALQTILERGRVGETYNVGGRAERVNLDVVGAICDLLDRRAPRSTGEPYRDLITFVTDRPGHDRRYAIDCTKLETQLGWQPSQSFESGLATTVDWYLENPAWWEPLRRAAGERRGLR
jgi:dTDP-glucose 4,6-dehydratase